jgi:uncharacterized protein YbcI
MKVFWRAASISAMEPGVVPAATEQPLGLGGEGRAGGRLNSAVASAVVRIHRDYIGRGPTKAQAFHRHEVLVVMLHDALTRMERGLLERGRRDIVEQARRDYHACMAMDLEAAVCSLTHRDVVALLHDIQPDRNVAVELFVLDAPV